MILVDTSVWVHVLRDKSGRIVQAFREKNSFRNNRIQPFYSARIASGRQRRV